MGLNGRGTSYAVIVSLLLPVGSKTVEEVIYYYEC